MKITHRMAEILNAAHRRRVRRNVHTVSAWHLDWFVPVTTTVLALQRRGLVTTLTAGDGMEFLVPNEAGLKWLEASS